MAWLDRYNVRGLVFNDTAVRVFDVDLSSDEEAGVSVHAQIGANNRFHVDRPAESGGIDHALDARGAGAAHLEPDVANVAALGPLHRGEQRIGPHPSASGLLSFRGRDGRSHVLSCRLLLLCHRSSPTSAF